MRDRATEAGNPERDRVVQKDRGGGWHHRLRPHLDPGQPAGLGRGEIGEEASEDRQEADARGDPQRTAPSNQGRLTELALRAAS
jgi:hypothetical protein